MIKQRFIRKWANQTIKTHILLTMTVDYTKYYITTYCVELKYVNNKHQLCYVTFFFFLLHDPTTLTFIEASINFSSLSSCDKDVLMLLHKATTHTKRYFYLGEKTHDTALYRCPGALKADVSLWYWLGRTGRERRVKVALLQDFLRVLGLTEGLEGPSAFSIGTPCLSSSECLSPTSMVWVVGDGTSVRGDLRGGAVLGLVEEHLLDVWFIELS